MDGLRVELRLLRDDTLPVLDRRASDVGDMSMLVPPAITHTSTGAAGLDPIGLFSLRLLRCCCDGDSRS